jgi:anaerobic magnesium-protoporphyrin IX monomethyl ester cyclase
MSNYYADYKNFSAACPLLVRRLPQMKVLLLEHPRQITPERCNDIANTPLSSCLLSGYAAATLKRDGHDVHIVEGYLDKLSYDEIWKIIEAMKPDILGVHMVYHWRRDDALFSFLGKVKECLSPYVVAYGFYPTIASEDILVECGAIDSVILGEPELPFSRLAGSFPARDHVAGIPGMAHRDISGNIHNTRPEPVEDLDSIPFPVRTAALLRLREVNILGSRGCYGKCTFCYINTFFGRDSAWRRRSPENIIWEIDSLISQTGLRDFYFTDPNFFGAGRIGQERAMRIASLLRERNIHFGIEGRVNDIHDRTIGALAEAGLRHILIGLESGSDESLRRMNKMTTVAQNEQALRILRRHGIEPNVGFIMFEPDSTLDDIRTNFEFLRRNELLRNLAVTANVLYHHQIILEGTEAYRALKKEGRLVTGPAGYEGTAYLRIPEVASLAEIMRRLTNALFSRMDGIWSGHMIEPPGAGTAYTKVNRLIEKVFEESLKALESGEMFSEEQVSSIVSAAENEMGNELSFSNKIC